MTAARVEVVDFDHVAFHRLESADAQGDQVGADGGAAGENAGEGIGFVALRPYPENAASLRAIVLIEPIKDIHMGPFVEAKQAVRILVEDPQPHRGTLFFHLADRHEFVGGGLGRNGCGAGGDGCETGGEQTGTEATAAGGGNEGASR